MQHCYIKKTSLLAGCQPTEFFFINFLFYLYERIWSTRSGRLSGITRSASDSFFSIVSPDWAKKVKELWFIWNWSGHTQVRSSRPQMFFKIGILKNFPGKHLCWSRYLIKLQGWGSATLLKKTLTQVLHCNSVLPQRF